MIDPISTLNGKLAGGPAFLILGSDEIEDTSAIRDYPWSGVYTSRHDSTVVSIFASHERTVTRYGPMDSDPTRSTTELQIRHLFGGLLLPPEQAPGTNAIERAHRRSAGIRELNRLTTETITPRGVLLIEGWGSGDDLTPEDLISSLVDLGPGQVHLFSAQEHQSDEFVQDLARRGILILHEDSLERQLERLEDRGALPRRSSSSNSIHLIPVSDRFEEIDIATWNEIRRSARPVDLDLLRPPTFSSDAARYKQFRDFMGSPDGVPNWPAIVAGMNLERDFEQLLRSRVGDSLNAGETFTPLIVSGQTSTGKSIALASLSITFATSGRAAVIYQSRRTTRPKFDDIEKFAQWAEDHGAPQVLFVWDGMTDVSEYETMARRLHSRGRNVVVVGTTYKTPYQNNSIIEAPAELSAGELRRLTRHLDSYGIEVRPKPGPVDASFLAFLYRALPVTEYGLRHGLASEMRSAERGLIELSSAEVDTEDLSSRATAMSRAFVAAGYQLPTLNDSSTDESRIYEASFDERNAIQRVTTLVVVAGRYGLPVPIDLALRVLGREGSHSIRKALISFDIIRDDEDDDGELYLTTRSRLEALLLTQHEVPLAVEAEVIKSVVKNARLSTSGTSGTEVNFVVQLLELVGANSLEKRFPRYYLDFATALMERREDDGLANPRLVLQESTLIRAHVRDLPAKSSNERQESISLLERNRDLLEDTLQEEHVRGQIRMSLTVELASTLGTISHELTKYSNDDVDTSGLSARLDDIFNAVKIAISIDPTSTYPIDVLAWVTRDALVSGALSEEQRLDRAATAFALIESVDRDLVSHAKIAKLDERSATLQQIIGNDDAVWKHLAALEGNQDPAATYFLAAFSAREGLEGERQALTRLKESPATYQDWRCADLLFRLTWKAFTSSTLMRGERNPIFLESNQLRELRILIDRIEQIELPAMYRLTYVKAILKFLEGDYAGARRDFQVVQEETRPLTKRLHTTHVIAGQDGRPSIFSGRVEWSKGRAGDLWVNELGTRVRFDPLRFFASGEAAESQIVSRFTIGFKLSTGTVAEPLSMTSSARS